MFCSKEDDLFIRHAKSLRHAWRAIGPAKLIKIAQANAERLARFNRKQVLKQDDWMDESLPFQCLARSTAPTTPKRQPRRRESAKWDAKKRKKECEV
jgi:hypothetical protein